MKKLHYTLALFVAMLLATISNVYSQNTAKPAAKPSPKEVALQRAEANLTKIERKIDVADSLIAISNKDYNDAQSAIDKNNADRKALDKQYAAKKKVLDKQVLSKDKQEAAKAKAELKTLDTEYKASTKTSDTELKANLKKSDAAAKILGKAELDKKTGVKELKEARKVAEAARKEAKGPEAKEKKK